MYTLPERALAPPTWIWSREVFAQLLEHRWLAGARGRSLVVQRQERGWKNVVRLQDAARCRDQEPRAVQTADRSRVAGGEPLPLLRHHDTIV